MGDLARFSVVDNNLMEFRAANDEVMTPLQPRDAATAIVRLLFTNLGGVFHLAGPEALTAYALVCRQVAAAGVRTPVRRISRRSLLPPNRPHNVSLSAEKLRRACPNLCFSKVVPSSCDETMTPDA
jgi:dTDP-4-dehydrorhamnose reductase